VNYPFKITFRNTALSFLKDQTFLTGPIYMSKQMEKRLILWVYIDFELE